jgi:hypothetical protein
MTEPERTIQHIFEDLRLVTETLTKTRYGPRKTDTRC